MSDFYDGDMGGMDSDMEGDMDGDMSNESDFDFDPAFDSDFDSAFDDNTADLEANLEAADYLEQLEFINPVQKPELEDPDFVIEEIDVPLNEGYSEGLDPSFNPELDLDRPFEPTEKELFGETEFDESELDKLIDAQIEDHKLMRDNEYNNDPDMNG